MRRTLRITLVGFALGIAGCAVNIAEKEGMLVQAGFRKVVADTPSRAQHVQTVAPYKLIKRTSDGKTYYVFADPDHCKCMFVGSEAAYAKYKAMVQREEDFIAYEDARQEEEKLEGR
jgi:hypothetical protein